MEKLQKISIKLIVSLILCSVSVTLTAQNPLPVKPRILISTDIGGTDPDDNQSMAHFLMYSNLFETEGLISSPSYGLGSMSEILRMIDLYEKDLPKLKKHAKGFPTPKYLRSISKQGRKGAAPYCGYKTPTGGSEWIIKCARKKSSQLLWVLVWGGLDDLAQALHDAPDIKDKIKVYWIGGPNKKWSTNSYAYIAEHFTDLWFIEVNSSYYGFFSDKNTLDSVKSSDYYSKYIRGAGQLGKDFKKYYGGQVKMGDTPSLLYMMHGEPADPMGESWGGSFEKISHSPRMVFDRVTDITDTVAFCTIVEFYFKGPEINVQADSVCFWMETKYGKSVQKWAGYYLGNGQYGVRYAPKQAEIVEYSFSSDISGFNLKSGKLVVENLFPGKRNETDYVPGNNWFADKAAPSLYEGKIQGGKTVSKWRQEALLDWAKRWEWLKE